MSTAPSHSQAEIRALLEELLGLEDSGSLFVSLYLDTSVNAAGQRTHALYLKQKTAELAGVLAAVRGEQAVREFEANVAKIETFLARHLLKITRGVAAFSSVSRGYFSMLQLPVPVRNKLAASSAPNLDVLIELLQQNMHFCAVTFDQHSAKILSVYLTDVVRKREMSNPPIPPGQLPGTASRLRYQERIKDHLQHFLRDIAQAVEKIMREEKPRGLVLLGTPSNIAELRKRLSPEIDKQVILTTSLPPDTPDGRLVERVVAEIRNRRGEQAEHILESLYDRLSQDYMAVAGVEATLFHLQMGKVDSLVITSQFADRGRKCARCNSLFPPSLEICTYCQGETVSVDLRNRMEKLAEQQDVRIEVVEQRSFLDYLGGVAALLRF